MKSEKKTFIIIFLYCLVLWLTNWSMNREFSREKEIYFESNLDLRGLGILLGGIASIILARRIWLTARMLWATGIEIPIKTRLWGSWSYLGLLVPLAFGATHHSSGTAEGGANLHTVFEYGGGTSLGSILSSAIAIMLYQLLTRLKSFTPARST